MQHILVGMLTLFLLVGCQAQKPLPYAAGKEGPARFIRADYVQIGSKIQVVVDASAYHVNSASIERTNGQDIKPLAIQRPQSSEGNLSNIGTLQGGYIGSGRNAGPTIGVSDAGNVAQSKTYIWFDLLSLGDAPWKLKLNLVGMGDVTIELPAKTMDTPPTDTTPTPSQVQ